MTTIGILPLGRPTFDVPFAEEVKAAALSNLAGSDAEVVGSTDLLLDGEATDGAIAALRERELDLLLILQVTFTDADAIQRAARAIDAPIALWAFPEDRTGGRLRLNSFCGINLAAHALADIGRTAEHLYRPADDPGVLDELRTILQVRPARGADWEPSRRPDALPAPAVATATEVRDRLRDVRVGAVGDHPDGFHPCRYDAEALRSTVGAEVERLELDELFATARQVGPERRAQLRERVGAALTGVDDVDQEALGATLDTYAALRSLADERGWSGVAVRCWPEMFTEQGGAACAAMAMMTDEEVPAACERDVNGNVTEVALSALAGDVPAFIADLVDLDVGEGTGVLWHCGLAPLSMADPDTPPRAGLHSNRQKPLVHEFALRPGRITIARLHESPDGLGIVLGSGEMISAPPSFSGTSGVVRFDGDAARILATIVERGLEHHYAFVYADIRDEVRALAALWDLPVLELA